MERIGINSDYILIKDEEYTIGENKGQKGKDGHRYGGSFRVNLPPLCGLKKGDKVKTYRGPDGSILLVPMRKLNDK